MFRGRTADSERALPPGRSRRKCGADVLPLIQRPNWLGLLGEGGVWLSRTRYAVLVVVDQPTSIGTLAATVARDLSIGVAYLPGPAARRISDLHLGRRRPTPATIAEAARSTPHALRPVDIPTTSGRPACHRRVRRRPGRRGHPDQQPHPRGADPGPAARSRRVGPAQAEDPDQLLVSFAVARPTKIRPGGRPSHNTNSRRRSPAAKRRTGPPISPAPIRPARDAVPRIAAKMVEEQSLSRDRVPKPRACVTHAAARGQTRPTKQRPRTGVLSRPLIQLAATTSARDAIRARHRMANKTAAAKRCPFRLVPAPSCARLRWLGCGGGQVSPYGPAGGPRRDRHGRAGRASSLVLDRDGRAHAAGACGNDYEYHGPRLRPTAES